MTKTRQKRGRPRKFCEQEALQATIGVFLNKGYEATSLDDLTEELGINKPSLYSAFGNKEELFIKAIQFYHSQYVTYLQELLSQNLPPRETLRIWLDWFLKNFSEQDQNQGCLIANSTTLCSPESGALAEEIQKLHNINEKLLNFYFEKCQEEGSLSPNFNALALSQFFNTVVQGMAVLRRAHGDLKALKNVADTALEILHES